MGLGLLYTGLRLRPGDEVLTTEHDFYATHEALRLRQVRDGVTVRRVRLYDDPESADATQMVQRLAAAVTPATRVVAVTWVHSSSGVKLPIAAMAAELARANAGRAEADRLLFCVDGVHGFGVEDTTPADLGCDFLVSGCHKWLFGPRGTGLIWGRAEAWSRITPVVPSFSFDSIGAWIQGVEPAGPPGPAATPGGLPQLRAPVGPRRGFRAATGDRRRPGSEPHPGTGDGAQGRARRHGPRATAHSPLTRRVVRPRVLRDCRCRPARRRGPTAWCPGARDPDPVRDVVPAIRHQHPHE